MKTIYALFFLIVFSTIPYAQFKTVFDKNIQLNQRALLSQQISKGEGYRYSDSISNPTKPDSLSRLKKEILDTNKLKNNIYDTNIKSNVVAPDTNSKKILVKDSTAQLYNEYRGLLNDDTIYNKRAPLWQPIIKVVIENTLLNLFDHYIMNYDWSVWETGEECYNNNNFRRNVWR